MFVITWPCNSVQRYFGYINKYCLQSTPVITRARMSIQSSSQPSLAAAIVSLRGLTMADVLDRLGRLTELDKTRRSSLMSAVRTFCRGLGKAPIDISAEPRAIRESLARLSPGALGLSLQSFSNLRSLLVKALTTAGIDTIGVRSRGPLSPAWELLVGRLVDKTMRCALDASTAAHIGRGYCATSARPEGRRRPRPSPRRAPSAAATSAGIRDIRAAVESSPLGCAGLATGRTADRRSARPIHASM